MTSKQRHSVVFAMLSLTILMLCFQNCSSGSGINSLGSALDGDGLITPPTVFASTTPNCSQPYSNFVITQTVYMCVQNAGAAPTYCHTYAGSMTCSREIISPASGWSGMGGNWVKAFPAASVFGVGTFTAYGMHTEDPDTFGQANFTVSQ